MCVPFSLLVGRWYICAEIQKTENYESRESTRIDANRREWIHCLRAGVFASSYLISAHSAVGKMGCRWRENRGETRYERSSTRAIGFWPARLVVDALSRRRNAASTLSDRWVASCSHPPERGGMDWTGVLGVVDIHRSRPDGCQQPWDAFARPLSPRFRDCLFRQTLSG